MEKIKTVVMVPPQLHDDGDFAGNKYVDTAGWSGLRVTFITGTNDAAIGSTAEGTAPLLEECDTTNGSYTAITGAALADAIAATEDDSVFAIDVDLRRMHKRYVRVQAPHAGNGTTGCNLCIIGQLTGPQQSPRTATEMGLVEHIAV